MALLATGGEEALMRQGPRMWRRRSERECDNWQDVPMDEMLGSRSSLHREFDRGYCLNLHRVVPLQAPGFVNAKH